MVVELILKYPNDINCEETLFELLCLILNEKIICGKYVWICFAINMNYIVKARTIYPINNIYLVGWGENETV